MEKINFTIRGAKEMEALLKDLGPKVANRLGDKALRAAAKPIVQDAKRYAPKKTGELRRSIRAVTARGRQNERVVKIGFKPPTSRRAHLTEFGTAHSAAHPFIRPALDANAKKALDLMSETLATGLAREEWKKALTSLSEGQELDFGEE